MRRLPVIIGLALAVFVRPAAEAQSADPFQWSRANPIGQTVANRPRPELDPLGIRAGSFRFYPSLTVETEYEDNVFRSERDRVGDLAITAAPRMTLKSDWNNHALEITADAALRRQVTESSLDRNDFGIEAKGRLDIRRDASISSSASLRRRHESLTSPDAGGANSPVQYDTAAVGLVGDKRFGRFSARAELAGERLDYRDSVRALTGAPINQDDRDRSVGRAALRGGYEISRQSEAYVRAEANVSDYRSKVDDGGFARSSSGVDLRAGAKLDLAGRAVADVYIGYRGQYYDDDGARRLNTDRVEALALGADVTANVTRLTTVNAGLRRDIFETTLPGSPGGVRTQADFGVDHELLRNLLLTGSVAGRVFQFEGADRDDYGLLVQFGAAYRMNRHLTLEGALEHETYSSTGGAAGADSASNRIMLRLKTDP
jgi:hypothetical protein